MITLTATGKHLQATTNEPITSGSVGLTATLTTDAAWAGLTVTVVFRVGTTEKIASLSDGVYTVPWELLVDTNVCKGLQAGICGMSGTDIVYPTVYAFVGTIREGADPTADPGATPTPTAYQTILDLVQQEADSATSAAAQAVIAVAKALEAATSATNAKTSETTAAQALSDLLALLGTHIATLTDGKLTPSQIPALSINDVFPVVDTTAMLALTAQRGDCALIVVDGTVTDSYMLAADDPTVASNWKKLGVSYVANAGHATTADNATNADKINNHRTVEMTEAQFTTAVKDNGTYYYVYPEAQS